MPDLGVTGYVGERNTLLKMGIPEVTSSRGAWSMRRTAAQMGKGVPGQFTADSGTIQTQAGWILEPFAGFRYDSRHLDYAGAIISDGDVTLAPGFTRKPYFRQNTDISGVPTDPAQVGSGVNRWRKKIPQGTDTSTQQLAGDAAQLPPPDDGGDTCDRVWCTTRSYPANSGFALYARVHEARSLQVFLRLYFGGNTAVDPATTTGGQFCLSFAGSGLVTLKEYTADATGDPWVLRHAFNWQLKANFTNGLIGFVVEPLTESRLRVKVGNLPEIPGRASSETADLTQEAEYWQDISLDTGHRHLATLTGEGPVRVDVLRDARIEFEVLRLMYPASGQVVDAPFEIPGGTPAGTPIRLTYDTFILPGDGGSVSGGIAAFDGTPLSQDGSGNFLSLDGVSRYFAITILNASSDRFRTPVVRGYTVGIAPTPQTITRTPDVSYNLAAPISVTGPDASGPDHETAQVKLRDLNAVMSYIQSQDRIRSTLGVYDSNGTLLSYLTEGEITKPIGKLRGTVGEVYPSPLWKDYDLRMVGLWSRIAQKYPLAFHDFGSDYNAAPLETGAYPPWKLTDILKFVLSDCSFPPDEIGIPDLDFRFWANPNTDSQRQFVTDPTTTYLELLNLICGTYLNAVLVRNANAGARGMWELAFRPLPPYGAPLVNFVTTGSPSGPAHNAFAWGANTTYIKRNTLSYYTEAPECNVVIVSGLQGSGDGTSLKFVTTIRNEESISNPAHADYLGYELPFIRPPDPGILTQEQANFVAAAEFEQSAHLRRHAEFVAPLVFVTDSNPNLMRPRPLRAWDTVSVDGNLAAVEECNPMYEHDWNQWAHMDVRFLP